MMTLHLVRADGQQNEDDFAAPLLDQWITTGGI